MSSPECKRENLLLFRQTIPGADSDMAADIVSQQINSGRAPRIPKHRILVKPAEEIRFKSLVAAIQQRDAAEQRVTFWKRAFLLLACSVGAASVALVLTWMKGRI